MSNKKPQNESVSALLLDENDIFQAVVTVKRSELTSQHVMVGCKDCDLPKGKYRFHRDRNRFEPLPEKSKQNLLTQENAIHALSLAVLGLREQGIALPKITLQYLQEFEASVDVAGLGAK